MTKAALKLEDYTVTRTALKLVKSTNAKTFRKPYVFKRFRIKLSLRVVTIRVRLRFPNLREDSGYFAVFKLSYATKHYFTGG